MSRLAGVVAIGLSLLAPALADAQRRRAATRPADDPRGLAVTQPRAPGQELRAVLHGAALRGLARDYVRRTGGELARFELARYRDGGYRSTGDSALLLPLPGTRLAIDADGGLYSEASERPSSWNPQPTRRYARIDPNRFLELDLGYHMKETRGSSERPATALVARLLDGAPVADRRAARALRKEVGRLEKQAGRGRARAGGHSRMTRALDDLGLAGAALTAPAYDRVFGNGAQSIALHDVPDHEVPPPLVRAATRGRARLLLQADGALRLEVTEPGRPPRLVPGPISPATADELFAVATRDLLAARFRIAAPPPRAGYAAWVDRARHASQLEGERFRRMAGQALTELAPIAARTGATTTIRGRRLIRLARGIAVDGRGRLHTIDVDDDHRALRKLENLSDREVVEIVATLRAIAGQGRDGELAAAANRAWAADRRVRSLAAVGSTLREHGLEVDSLTPELVDRLLAGEQIELARSPYGEHDFGRGRLWSLGRVFGYKVLVLAMDGLTMRTETGGPSGAQRFGGALDAPLIAEHFPGVDVAAGLGRALRTPAWRAATPAPPAVFQ